MDAFRTPIRILTLTAAAWLAASSLAAAQPAPPLPPAPAVPPPATAPSTTDTIDVWVCSGDDTTGLSFEGTCPLDGKPLVKKSMRRSQFTDIQNAKCPLCDMDTTAAMFAMYKGTLVRLGCRACERKFFKDPETAIAKAKTTAPR